MTDKRPFSYPFDLSSLSTAGHEEALEIPEAACRSIAETYKIDGIEEFTARFRFSRLAKFEYALAGQFAATVIQTCIVTLKPLRTRIEQDFKRRYDIAPRDAAGQTSRSVNVELESEYIETLHGSSLDLAIPLLEELSLAIDPYPRVPGAEFEAEQEEPAAGQSPFAVLQKLKDELETPEKT